MIGQVEITYETSDASAQSDDDFIQQSDKLVFTAGQQTQSFTIRILGVNNCNS